MWYTYFDSVLQGRWATKKKKKRAQLSPDERKCRNPLKQMCRVASSPFLVWVPRFVIDHIMYNLSFLLVELLVFEGSAWRLETTCSEKIHLRILRIHQCQNSRSLQPHRHTPAGDFSSYVVVTACRPLPSSSHGQEAAPAPAPAFCKYVEWSRGGGGGVGQPWWVTLTTTSLGTRWAHHHLHHHHPQ